MQLIISTISIIFPLIVQIVANNFTDEAYLNEWVIEIDGDDNYAENFAKLNDLTIIGKVGSLTGYYRLKLKNERKKRTVIDIENFENELIANSSIKWIERQKVVVRKKRDYTTEYELSKVEYINKLYNDPLWPQTWYLNRQRKHNIPDMNVIGTWSMGYSGRGVSVSFLDDGLERDHPDLIANYDPKASFDVNNNDFDPMPRYDQFNTNRHGTRCAGEVAAAANNSICSVGVAFNSGVGGIKMLDGDVTDSTEATSLSFNRNHIDIYSASWGPDDNGEVVDGPGKLARKAFIEGVTFGRKGKGSIFIWASGNGGRYDDTCSCDGYVNSIYTFAISSTSEKSEKPWYLEECPATLTTTYSSGNEKSGDMYITTTDIRHKCTVLHTGTSAAAPLAAGIIALVLEANSSLTWRDVMYIVVLSSRPKAIKSNNYMENKRGLLVSSRYGFGLMDARRMVELARTWRNVPKMRTCSSANDKIQPEIVIKNDIIYSFLRTDGCVNTTNEVNFIEQVEFVLKITCSNRGGLEIIITSPGGTRSVLLSKRKRDTSQRGFEDWSFMSVQTWGENASGLWKLKIKANQGVTVNLRSFYMNIHGTKEEPVDYKSFVTPNASNINKPNFKKAKKSSTSNNR